MLHGVACERRSASERVQGVIITNSMRTHSLRLRPCSRLNDNVKLAGATLSCHSGLKAQGNASSSGALRRSPRIPLGAVATDSVGLEVMLNDGQVGGQAVGLECPGLDDGQVGGQAVGCEFPGLDDGQVGGRLLVGRFMGLLLLGSVHVSIMRHQQCTAPVNQAHFPSRNRKQW